MEQLGFTAMKYPEMRQELVVYLRGLSDFEYQKNCWVNRDCPRGVQQDNFDLVIHFMFDDTMLSTNAKIHIGELLVDEAEASSIQDLCRSIDLIFDLHGLGLSDEEYIHCPEWPEVLAKAKRAYELLCRAGDVMKS